MKQQICQIVDECFLVKNWKPWLIEEVNSMNVQSRQNHFIGRMLRHHQHRSTEYMSRWIEAKNRLSGGA